MLNVLVLCDDYWHPGEVVQMGLLPLEEKGYHFTFVKDAKDILSVDMLQRYPVVMNCKNNNINNGNANPWFEEGVTEVGPAELRAYVEAGGGFLSVHSGNAFMEGDNREYMDLIGGRFITHPPRCNVDVHITGKHFITEGVCDFSLRDEHYQMEVWASDITELFRVSSASGGDQIGGYTRNLGKGRLCVLTPGHILDVWRKPEFVRLLTNALEWAAGEG